MTTTGATDVDPLSDRLAAAYRRLTGGPSSIRKRLSVLELLAEREVVSGPSVSMPLARRLSLWRHGFTSRSGALFDVEEGAYDEYLSDYQLERLDDLGGHWADVLDNKLAAQLLLFGSFSERLPDVYGVLDEGTLRRRLPVVRGPAGDDDAGIQPSTAAVGSSDLAGATDGVEAVERRLAADGSLVLKPVYGHGGKGVYVCRREANGTGGTGGTSETSGTNGGDGATYDVNGTTRSRAEFAALVGDLDAYVVSEFVEQAAYADSLFPEATNTLRVMTLWDDERGEPFVSGAVHRIGTRASAPVDNWSRGGLSAELDSDGTLGPGAQWDAEADRLRWHEAHPDTGSRIEGARVPGWPAIRAEVLSMARELSALPRVGWDLVVTGEGEFVVIELNTHAGIETIQVHGPHLRDPRTRRFFERRGFA